jgi:hypothetical protein
MKRLAGLSLVIGLLSLPIPAQAQVLTVGAATCTLIVIRAKAWAVTGLDLTLTPEMAPGWLNYLANRYPLLPDRYSIANACGEFDNNIAPKLAKWPQMPPVERELWQNMWATSLPQDLALIAPVFPVAAQQLRAALQSRAAQQNAVPNATQDGEAAAIAELQRRRNIGNILLNFNRNFYGR